MIALVYEVGTGFIRDTYTGITLLVGVGIRMVVGPPRRIKYFLSVIVAGIILLYGAIVLLPEWLGYSIMGAGAAKLATATAVLLRPVDAAIYAILTIASAFLALFVSQLGAPSTIPGSSVLLIGAIALFMKNIWVEEAKKRIHSNATSDDP